MSLDVIVADDHPVARIGIRMVVERALGPACRVAEADGVDALHRLLAGRCPDLLVTDLHMPGGARQDGVAMLRQLHWQHPRLPIVLLTGSRNLGLLRRCAEWGVRCVLSKQDDVEQLVAALRCAQAGQSFLGSDLQARLQLLHPGAAWPWTLPPLSPCERTVVIEWGERATLTQIAERRRRSLNTISRQKVMAMHKLCVDSDVELMELLRNGLVERGGGQVREPRCR